MNRKFNNNEILDNNNTGNFNGYIGNKIFL